MSKLLKATLIIGISLFVACSLAMGQANGQAKKDKKESHSRLSKVAFWRHHKESAKKAEQGKPESAKHSSAAVKPVSGKESATSKPTGKPVSGGKQVSTEKKSHSGKQKVSVKQSSAKKDKKEEQHSKAGKQSTKKASVVKVAKKGDKAPSPKTASVKQQ